MSLPDLPPSTPLCRFQTNPFFPLSSDRRWVSASVHFRACVCQYHSNSQLLRGTKSDLPATLTNLVDFESTTEVEQRLDACKRHSTQTRALSKLFRWLSLFDSRSLPLTQLLLFKIALNRRRRAIRTHASQLSFRTLSLSCWKPQWHFAVWAFKWSPLCSTCQRNVVHFAEAVVW